MDLNNNMILFELQSLLMDMTNFELDIFYQYLLTYEAVYHFELMFHKLLMKLQCMVWYTRELMGKLLNFCRNMKFLQTATP